MVELNILLVDVFIVVVVSSISYGYLVFVWYVLFLFIDKKRVYMEVYENEIFIVCKYFKYVNKGKKDLF